MDFRCSLFLAGLGISGNGRYFIHHMLIQVAPISTIKFFSFWVFSIGNYTLSRLDKQVLVCNIGSIFVSWYNIELSSWYLTKMRHQVDVYLVSIWSLYFFDLILMSWSWKINVKKTSKRWLLIYLFERFCLVGYFTEKLKEGYIECKLWMVQFTKVDNLLSLSFIGTYAIRAYLNITVQVRISVNFEWYGEIHQGLCYLILW
jgi:hypothetical protein